MRYPAKRLVLPAAVLVVTCLTAGCGNTASSVLNNLSTPSGTAATSTAAPATTATTASPATTATTVAPTTTATTTPSATVTVTASPSVTTVQPSTAHPATSAAPTSPAASATGGTGSGASLLWLWILLAVAALAGLIAWISHSARRRSADAASWRSRLIDAYAKGSALHDAMSVAETLGATGDAGARWADVQRRADDLTQTLYALREVARDPADQDRIADVLVSLQAVRSAMDAERAPGGAGPQQARVVSDRLYAFESSLRALRGSGQDFT